MSRPYGFEVNDSSSRLPPRETAGCRFCGSSPRLPSYYGALDAVAAWGLSTCQWELDIRDGGAGSRQGSPGVKSYHCRPGFLPLNFNPRDKYTSISHRSRLYSGFLFVQMSWILAVTCTDKRWRESLRAFRDKKLILPPLKQIASTYSSFYSSSFSWPALLSSQLNAAGMGKTGSETSGWFWSCFLGSPEGPLQADRTGTGVKVSTRQSLPAEKSGESVSCFWDGKAKTSLDERREPLSD